MICTAAVDGGTSAGTVSQEIADPAAVAAVVAEAERLARSGSAAEDATDPVADYPHSDGWDAAPETTGIEVLAELARALGEAFDRARAAEQLLFGFAEHVVSTTYLGSSTGLRRRGVQPTGRLELNAKTGRPDRVGLGRASDPGLHRRGHRRGCTPSLTAGWAGRRTKIELPPGPLRDPAAARGRWPTC